MNRRSASIALFFAAVLGGSSYATPAQADKVPPPRKQAPPPAPARCQSNSDCSANQVCKPVGDHKECHATQPRPIPVPT